MNRKEILMQYRNTKRIKGIKPAYVFLKRNIGKIYNGTSAKFILSIRDNKLIFQKLSFFNNLKPNLDFEINLLKFKEYVYCKMNQYTCSLILYDKNGKFIEIFYNCGLPDTYLSEDNMARIIKDIEHLGIKEVKNDEKSDK